jgi:hypothetical protein
MEKRKLLTPPGFQHQMSRHIKSLSMDAKVGSVAVKWWGVNLRTEQNLSI